MGVFVFADVEAGVDVAVLVSVGTLVPFTSVCAPLAAREPVLVGEATGVSVGAGEYTLRVQSVSVISNVASSKSPGSPQHCFTLVACASDIKHVWKASTSTFPGALHAS